MTDIAHWSGTPGVAFLYSQFGFSEIWSGTLFRQLSLFQSVRHLLVLWIITLICLNQNSILINTYWFLIHLNLYLLSLYLIRKGFICFRESVLACLYLFRVEAISSRLKNCYLCPLDWFAISTCLNVFTEVWLWLIDFRAICSYQSPINMKEVPINGLLVEFVIRISLRTDGVVICLILSILQRVDLRLVVNMYESFFSGCFAYNHLLCIFNCILWVHDSIAVWKYKLLYLLFTHL